MDVAIGRDDDEPRRFIFDIEEARWEELCAAGALSSNDMEDSTQR